MENAGFVFAAYSIVWAVVFGYILSLLRQQKRLRQQIDSMSKALKGKENK